MHIMQIIYTKHIANKNKCVKNKCVYFYISVTGFPVWATLVCTGVVAVIYTTVVSKLTFLLLFAK